MAEKAPKIALDSVLQRSDPMPEDSQVCKGYDFSNGVDYHALLSSYRSTGFQAMHFGKAVEEINKMVSKARRFKNIIIRGWFSDI